MRFPKWVDGPKKTRMARASARLRFIINQYAAHHTQRGSIRALAQKVGLDHSTISTYIRRGAFTENSANTIVTALGLDAANLAYLTHPLDIK